MVKGARPGDAEALLGTGVADVDAPVVGPQLDPADAGDRIGDEQRVTLGRAQRGNVGTDAGRRLRVHRGDHLRIRVGVEDPVNV